MMCYQMVRGKSNMIKLDRECPNKELNIINITSITIKIQEMNFGKNKIKKTDNMINGIIVLSMKIKTFKTSIKIKRDLQEAKMSTNHHFGNINKNRNTIQVKEKKIEGSIVNTELINKICEIERNTKMMGTMTMQKKII